MQECKVTAVARGLTAEPATAFAETGFHVRTLHDVHRQHGDQETRRAAPSPDTVNVEEHLFLHPEVLEPVRNQVIVRQSQR